MRRRTVSRLSWSLWGACLLIAVGTVALSALKGVSLSAFGSNLILFAALGTVGALVVSRVPGNRLGLVLLGMSVLVFSFFPVQQLALYGATVQPGAVPGVTWMAWLIGWVWILGFAPLLLFVTLLFPDGRLPSPRWRPYVWSAVAFVAAMIPVFMLLPVRYDTPPVRNPIGIESAGPALHFLATAATPVVIALTIVSAASLFVRYRRASGRQRLQIKWFGYGAAFMAIGFVVSGILSGVGLVGASDAASNIGFLGIPAGVGIAILRYRLYDIDRIINRTLVYGALTALLVGVYVGIAVGLGSLAGKSNSLAIAGATLVIAALFQPARRRIQSVIDRRCYRRRYDATQTLETFTSRLRDEVNLDELRDHLLAVVGETMEPAQAVLWLGPARELP